jgi:hypothetical protein
MENDSFDIQLRAADGQTIPAQILLMDVGDDSCLVRLTFQAQSLERVASDYFEAFADIRNELWAVGMVPMCLGAVENVFPSPMSRQMGCGGTLAYRLTLGRQAHTKDLVEIFDPAEAEGLVAPDQQMAFYKKWIASLGRR